MRLPCVPNISTKDGQSNKNARLTNCLKESKKTGEKAVVRPGLVLDVQASGVGNGLVVFNNELVSVYGATLGLGITSTGGGVGSDSWGLYGNKYLEYFDAKWYIPQTDFTSTILTYVTYTPSLGVIATESIATATTLASILSMAVGSSKVIAAFNIDGTVKIYDITGTPVLRVTISGFIYSHVRFLNGMFIVVSAKNGGTSGGTYIHTSTDGVNWTEYFYSDADLYDVSWSGSGYVLIGYGYPLATYGTCTAHTTNFTSFTLYQINGAVIPEQIFSEICYVGGKYYATDTASVGTYSLGESDSSDGITWADTGSYSASYKYDDQVAKWIRYRATAFDLYDGGWVEEVALNPCFDISFKGSSEYVSTAGIGVWYSTLPEYTIPPLATITGDRYDFAQSPL